MKITNLTVVLTRNSMNMKMKVITVMRSYSPNL